MDLWKNSLATGGCWLSQGNGCWEWRPLGIADRNPIPHLRIENAFLIGNSTYADLQNKRRTNY